jgi:type I restriction enzyme S subunit
MTDRLFIGDVDARDPIYNIIRDEKDDPYIVEVRVFMEKLWQMYHPYADTHFRQQIQEDFHARFWEMYITCALLENSLPVKSRDKISRDKGPDVLIEDQACRIWVEAIAPSSGADENPDRVPDLKLGVAMRDPDEQIILRYRSAISEKFDNKYREYLATDVVSSSDAYVIAINSCKMEAAIADSDPPRILKAVFPIGDQQVTVNKQTLKIIGSGFQFRPAVKRTSGEQISTDLFLNPTYENLSGILFSRASVNHLIKQLGADFIFIHNPLARNPVPSGFFKFGREYTAQEGPENYTVTYKDWSATEYHSN